MTTDKTPATLATVPYDRARELIGDAYNAGTHGIGYSQQIMELHDAVFAAQPSPGGKGDALLREVSAQLESLDCGACIGSDAPMEDLHGRIAAHLAARQPVGEPVVMYCGRRLTPEGTRECWGVLEKGVEDLPPNTKLYAAPPAQAVDLGQLQRYEAIGSDGMNMERVPDGRWVKLDDVRALIDSQAVGNGH